MAATFRSLGSNDPLAIQERSRLSAASGPHVILDCDGGSPPATFVNNAWNRSIPEVVVFDDLFVTQNIYSGLAVETEHRQNMHELILGVQGINFHNAVQGFAAQVEAHNVDIRTKAGAIPAVVLGTLTVDEFCSLSNRDNIDEAVHRAERNLAAARQQDPIRTSQQFAVFSIPSFDIEALNEILATGLADLDTSAAALVQRHLADLPHTAETWIGDGMKILASPNADGSNRAHCPFCAQGLDGSPVLSHYRAYFSQNYTNLKQSVVAAIGQINQTHGGDGLAKFERTLRVTSELRVFWSAFCDIPTDQIDSTSIGASWETAKQAALTALRRKSASPLEKQALSTQETESIKAYGLHVAEVARFSSTLQTANSEIAHACTVRFTAVSGYIK